MADRTRSASPARDTYESSEPRSKKQKTGGFKWKEKKAQDGSDAVRATDLGRLERGYRNRSPVRRSYGERGQDQVRESEREGQKENEGRVRRDGEGDGESRPLRSSQHEQEDGDKHQYQADSVRAKFGDSYQAARPRDDAAQPPSVNATPRPAAPSQTKKKKKPPPTTPSSPMIIVNVNDRLGTKAAIPCLASDSVRAFKAVVAAHVGRRPHEIMLKRQGERPFKDQLTLEDYGVSHGVQLDLELDTGD